MRSVSHLLCVACLGVLLSVLLLASTNASAQQPTPQTALFAKEIAEMKATRALLESANHDYAGHRAAAVRELTVAIHALEPPHESKAAKVGKAVAKATGNAKAGKEAAREVKQAEAIKKAEKKAVKATIPPVHEPQVLSDAQLKEAAAGLRVIHAQMLNTKHPAAGKVAAALAIAFKEIEIAVTIR